MNRKELINKIGELDVKSIDYSLDGRLIEGLNLESSINYYGEDKSYEEWIVFENERGNRYNEKSYPDVELAYDDIYERLKSLSEYNQNVNR